MNFMDFAGN